MKNFLDENFILDAKTAQRLYHEFAAGLTIIDYHAHLLANHIAGNINPKGLMTRLPPYRNVVMSPIWAAKTMLNIEVMPNLHESGHKSMYLNCTTNFTSIFYMLPK